MHKRTGKVACLPKDLRDLVNHMLDDGAQYTSIIRELEKHRQRWPDGVSDFTENNLSGWHNGGYQDWLKAQERLDDREFKLELARQQAQHGDPSYQDAGLHLAQLQFYEALNRLDGALLSALVQKQPKEFLHLLKSFTHFNRCCLERDKFRHELTRQQKADADKNKPREPVTPENLDMLCEKYGLT
jgi:hypothetical protein